MRNKLSRSAVLVPSRDLHDVDMLVVWCGVLTLFGHGQVGVSRRTRLTGIAVGVALVILGRLMDVDRRLMAGYDTVARVARRRRPPRASSRSYA